MPSVRCGLRKEPACKSTSECVWLENDKKCTPANLFETVYKGKKIAFKLNPSDGNREILIDLVKHLNKFIPSSQMVLSINPQDQNRVGIRANDAKRVYDVVSETCNIHTIELPHVFINTEVNAHVHSIQIAVNKLLRNRYVLPRLSEIKIGTWALADMYFVSEVMNMLLYGTRSNIRLFVDNDNKGFIAYDPCGVNKITYKEYPFFAIPFSQMHAVENHAVKNKYKLFMGEEFFRIGNKIALVNKEIRHAYVHDNGSTELNLSMMLYLMENEALYDDISTRIIQLLKVFKKLSKLKNHKKPFVVYHGTNQLIHSSNKFQTTAFMSTTRKAHTAYSYAGYPGVIYVIEIPQNYPILNLHDHHQQLLLPIGTEIQVSNTIQYFQVKVVFCKVTSNLPDFDQLVSIFKYPCVNPYQIRFKADHPFLATHLYGKELVPVTMRGSSSFYSISNKTSKYVVKDIVKRTQSHIRVLANDNQVFKRILNEMFAAQIYKVYGLETLNYQMLMSEKVKNPTLLKSNILITSKVVKVRYTIKPKERVEIFKGFLVDCILSNWDVFNNENIGVLRNGKIIRTDVGGACAFRGRGDVKLQFVPNVEPTDHQALSVQRSFKSLKIPAESYQVAIEHLDSIKNVAGKLEAVKSDFIEMLNLIDNKELVTKYTGMLEAITETVLYRDQWYRANAVQALATLGQEPRNIVQAGGKESSATPPLAYTVTPGHFKRILEKFQKCEMKSG